MAKFDVVNLDLKKVSEIELSDDVFGAEMNDNLIYEVAKFQQINRRAGTVAVKNSSLVSGGGKKPWKQKGTGRARHGSNRSPIWRHGGTTHGPQPRDYGYAFSKAKRNLALRTSFSAKIRDGKLLVLENFQLAAPKTKEVAAIRERFGWKNALVVDAGNAALGRASANLKSIKAIRPEEINVYDVLKYDRLVVTVGGLKKIEEVFAS